MLCAPLCFLQIIHVTLQWEGLTYSVPVGRRRRRVQKAILQGVSGHVLPGHLLAVMGPTGGAWRKVAAAAIAGMWNMAETCDLVMQLWFCRLGAHANAPGNYLHKTMRRTPAQCSPCRQWKDKSDQRAGGAAAQGRRAAGAGAGERRAPGQGVQEHHLLRAAGAPSPGAAGGARQGRKAGQVRLCVCSVWRRQPQMHALPAGPDGTPSRVPSVAGVHLAGGRCG